MTPVVLIVLDGFGVAPPGPGNAISLANPDNFNSFLYSFPNTTLKASGQAVGLPADEVGNTEVGHLNLGAGKIVYQDLPRINMSIADGTFYKNSILLGAVDHAKKNNGKLHLLGLVSEGVVHSSIDHLFALIYLVKEQGFHNVFIHAITDGRDSPPKSAETTLKRLEKKTQELGVGTIASVMGRYLAMDRDRRWDRTEKAYVCLTEGIGNNSNSPYEAIEASYKEGKTDEFIDPANVVKDGKPVALIGSGDSVIFFNYRIDRPRQLTKAFVLENFEKDANKITSFDPYAVKYYKTHFPKEQIVAPPFTRKVKLKNLFFVTLTEYEKQLPAQIAFPPVKITEPLGKVISDVGFHQLRMAESEKERFVTFYFNGQNEETYKNEERLIVPSPKVATYDMKPEMSTYELASLLVEKMKQKKYQFILINFACTDMVGHTGNIEATTQAVKAVDSCLKNIIQEGTALGYTILITGDHGNAEQKIDPKTGQLSTEHTDNPVPFVAVGNAYQGKLVKLQPGILGDVAPTVLTLLDLPKPTDMTGRNLLEEVL